MLPESMNESKTGRNLYFVIQKALDIETRNNARDGYGERPRFAKKIFNITKNRAVGMINFRYFEICIIDDYIFTDGLTDAV